MYYEDYNYFSDEDFKTDFHIALDDLINAEVEKRLEVRITDIDHLREEQKQYEAKIVEANLKVQEANTKRQDAERAVRKAEAERDDTIKQCKQSISDATQQKLNEMFGDWLKEKYAYYVVREESWQHCPYCRNGKVEITLPTGDQATTSCKVCNGEGHIPYYRYDSKSIETTYPTFVQEAYGNLTPYFLRHTWNTGLTRVALRDVMTHKEAEDKAKQLTEENKQKVIQRLEERKKKLDEENKL